MDFTKDFEKIEEEFKQKQRQSRNEAREKRHIEQSHEAARIEDRYFDLLRNCTILTGTVFASTVALSTGKSVNSWFLIGELLLLLATLIGVLYLWSQLRALELSYHLDIKWNLESDLIVYREIINDFEKNTIHQTINAYDNLINRKGFSYHILKLMKVDWLPTIFFTLFCSGLVLIWLSLF